MNQKSPKDTKSIHILTMKVLLTYYWKTLPTGALIWFALIWLIWAQNAQPTSNHIKTNWHWTDIGELIFGYLKLLRGQFQVFVQEQAPNATVLLETALNDLFGNTRPDQEEQVLLLSSCCLSCLTSLKSSVAIFPKINQLTRSIYFSGGLSAPSWEPWSKPIPHLNSHSLQRTEISSLKHKGLRNICTCWSSLTQFPLLYSLHGYKLGHIAQQLQNVMIMTILRIKW